MKNIWKRSLSMLLALVLVLGMVPVGVLAAEGDTQTLQKGSVVEQLPDDDLVWIAGEEKRICDYALAHTHSASCYRQTCKHEEGHSVGAGCYGVTWAVCPGDGHEHTESKLGSEITEDSSLYNQWKAVRDNVYNSLVDSNYEDAYYNGYGSLPGYNKAYQDATWFKDTAGKIAGAAAREAAKLADAISTANNTTFCATYDTSVTICGHGDTCSDYTGECYEKICLFNYEHTHENACYEVTWTQKADKNNNEVADDSESYTVIYTDGVADKEIFADVQTSGLSLGADTPTIDDPTRDNYVFTGWSPARSETITCPTVKGSTTITYTATWEPFNDNNGNDLADEDETYTVIYVDGFGNELKKFTEVAHNATTPTIADPEKEGYQFLYWSPEVVGNVETPTSGTTITYTAIWKQLGKFAVTFVDRDSRITIEYYEGERAQKPEDPTWDADHDFLGWYNGSELYDFDTVFTAESADLVLTAKWQEDYNRDDINDAEQPRYTVTYMNGYTDTPILSEAVLVNMPTPSVAEPVREGYTFTGWDLAWSATVIGNVTYTATWIKDVNQNEVDDALETITVITQGAGTVAINGTQTGTLIYDSTVTDTITVTATPVLSGNVCGHYGY